MTVQLKPVGYYWNYFLHANEEQLKLQKHIATYIDYERTYAYKELFLQ